MNQFLLQQFELGAVRTVAIRGLFKLSYRFGQQRPGHANVTSLRSSRNSLPGSTPVTSSLSRALVQAT